MQICSKVVFFLSRKICKHHIFFIPEKQGKAAAHFSRCINTIVFARAVKENITSDDNYRTEASHVGFDLSGSVCIGSG